MDINPIIIATNKLDFATYIMCNICTQIKNKSEGHNKNRFICKKCYNDRLSKNRLTNPKYINYQKDYYLKKKTNEPESQIIPINDQTIFQIEIEKPNNQ